MAVSPGVGPRRPPRRCHGRLSNRRREAGGLDTPSPPCASRRCLQIALQTLDGDPWPADRPARRTAGRPSTARRAPRTHPSVGRRGRECRPGGPRAACRARRRATTDSARCPRADPASPSRTPTRPRRCATSPDTRRPPSRGAAHHARPRSVQTAPTDRTGRPRPADGPSAETQRAADRVAITPRTPPDLALRQTLDEVQPTDLGPTAPPRPPRSSRARSAQTSPGSESHRTPRPSGLVFTRRRHGGIRASAWPERGCWRLDPRDAVAVHAVPRSHAGRRARVGSEMRFLRPHTRPHTKRLKPRCAVVCVLSPRLEARSPHEDSGGVRKQRNPRS